jgi:sporulation protein YlmC with PRC-barrel domain
MCQILSEVLLLAKTQKEKTVTKDRLVGMKVIDGEGNLVGTVKDIGFTVGGSGISLILEDKKGEIIEIPWEKVQGAGDFVILKPAIQAVPSQAPATQQAQPTQPICPTCKGPLSYIQQYQRWYCYKCQKYA